MRDSESNKSRRKDSVSLDMLSASFGNGAIALYLLLIFVLTPVKCALGQSSIPLGAWRIHISYHSINSLAIGDQKVFAAARNGVMIMDLSDNSITTHSKLDGLQGTAISFANYDTPTHLLVIAYENGKFDVVNPGGIITGFDPTGTSVINSSKTINHILFHGETAFLATAYGVVVFDLKRLQIRETWRDIGRDGTTLEILQSTVLGDSIFLATKSGVQVGDLKTNLLDFNKWKRFDTGDFSGTVEAISTFGDAVYAAIDGVGLMRYSDGNWTKEPYLQNGIFKSLNAGSGHLLIVEESGLWKLSSDQEITPITAESIADPQFATEDASGKFWVGDGIYGVVSNVSGSFVSYVPNSMVNERISYLKYHDGTQWGLAGGYASSGQPFGNPGILDLFNDGLWSTQKSEVKDITDVAFVDNGRYSASFGYGVEFRDSRENVLIYNEENSPLENTAPPGHSVNITSLAADDAALWVANYGASKPLHFLNSTGWQSYSFSQPASLFPIQLAVDFQRSVWAVLDPAKGGGILTFDKVGNRSAYLTELAGAGGLPSRSVRSIAVDRDGMVWVGTDAGVAFFMDPANVFATSVNAVKPIFESRFLLRDETVTSIAVDGGNRKWFGTKRGVWLFRPDGEEMVYYFNAENSPLLSNVIDDIDIDDQTGEVFFATDEGLVSFRADATESNATFQSVKVFPNPVTANFVGMVGISGLATDAIVKITDISGRLIWQTQANGGTASWRLQDQRGAHVPTGIYLVFAVARDGSESVVAKLAVVE